MITGKKLLWPFGLLIFFTLLDFYSTKVLIEQGGSDVEANPWL